LTATLQARGVARQQGVAAIWGILDGSDLRKPYATAMARLPRVKWLAGRWTVPGYGTLNAIGIGPANKLRPDVSDKVLTLARCAL
jgi:hypothetical protein